MSPTGEAPPRDDSCCRMLTAQELKPGITFDPSFCLLDRFLPRRVTARSPDLPVSRCGQTRPGPLPGSGCGGRAQQVTVA